MYSRTFLPMLFTCGPPKGLDRLLRKLSGQSSAEEVLEEWRRDDTDSPVPERVDPMTEHCRCTSCYLQGTESLHELKAFGVTLSFQFYDGFVAQGCWTRCLACPPEILLALSSSCGSPRRGSRD